MNNSIRHGILATVGQTPLVRLDRLLPDAGLTVHAKLERFNPTGSTEDRTALDLLLAPIRTGELIPGRPVVLTAGSGNLAIALAQVCRYYDLDLHLVTDVSGATAWHLAMVRAYGARVEAVRSEGDQGRLDRLADALAATLPGSYRPPSGHRDGPAGEVMAEIREQLGAVPDYLFCPASSALTLHRAVGYLREHRLPTTVVAVLDQPGAEPAAGLGAADLVERVDEVDTVTGCRLLLSREGLLAGRSSGSVVAALARLHGRIAPGAVCVLLLPDGGDRYTETVYSDAWVRSRAETRSALQEATR